VTHCEEKNVSYHDELCGFTHWSSSDVTVLSNSVSVCRVRKFSVRLVRAGDSLID